jgi:hypothetical protein
LYAGRKERENMIKLYKLTDSCGKTWGGTQWGPGVSHSGTGEGELCGPGWIHAYEHPLVAVLMNPIHANFKNPRLWEAEGEVGLRDGQIKCGCKTLTTVREIPLPSITTEMRVRFAILCAKEVCAYPAWIAWADRWLSGEDRSEAAAAKAEWAAWAAQAAAGWAAGAASAAYRSAAYRSAAYRSAWEAMAADAADAAEAAEAWAARAAEAAAYRSARAAEATARAAAWAAAEATARAAAWAAAEAAARAGTDIFAIAENACSGVHTFEES